MYKASVASIGVQRRFLNVEQIAFGVLEHFFMTIDVSLPAQPQQILQSTSITEQPPPPPSPSLESLLPHLLPITKVDLEAFDGVVFSRMFAQCTAQLRELHNVCFPIVYHDSFYESLVDDVESGGAVVCVLALTVDSGCVVGFATARVETATALMCRRARSLGYVSTFGVAPEYRKRGLGGNLLANVCRMLEAHPNRITACTLDVKVDNVAAIALYKKHGFVVQQRLEQHYYIDGQHHDAFHMVRTLKPKPSAPSDASSPSTCTIL